MPDGSTSLITRELHQSFQKQGATARALGRSISDCPLFRPEKMPAVTGEDAALWNAKCEAWRMGWTIEDAMR